MVCISCDLYLDKIIMALSASFVKNKNKCCGYGYGYHYMMKDDNACKRSVVRKGSLLATFAQSALLMRYNELIHKKENNNKSVHTSLNSCMYTIKRGGRNVTSYKYKSKKLCSSNNNNDSMINNTSCIMKNESTMTGTSFIASRSHVCRSNNNKRSRNSSIRKCTNNINTSISVNGGISNDDILRNSFVIQKIKLQQQQQQHKSMNVVSSINSSSNSDKHVCNLQMYKLDEIQGLSRFNAKKYKMISKYLAKQLHKGELYDDYLIGNCKPFDRFSNFKQESKIQYNVKENIILNLHEILSNNNDYLKLYSAGIKQKKYIIGFKRHKNNKQ